MIHNITYQMLTIRIAHHITVQIPRLNKIIVGVRIWMTIYLSRDFYWRFFYRFVWLRTIKTIRPVIRTAATVRIGTHCPITLIAVLSCIFRCIYWQQMVVRTQSVEMGIMIREKSTLKHLIRRSGNTRHKILRTECSLFNLRKVILRVAVQNQLANLDRWKVSMGPDFSDIKYIKTIILCLFRSHYLH